MYSGRENAFWGTVSRAVRSRIQAVSSCLGAWSNNAFLCSEKVRTKTQKPDSGCCSSGYQVSLTALIFVIAFLVGCVLAFARNPIFGLVTYVATFYLNPPSRWWGQGWLLEMRWAMIAAAVTILALAVRSGSRQTFPGFFRQKPVIIFCAFIGWIAIQSFWALDREANFLLLSYYLKFVIAIYLVYKCVDSAENLRLFLWTHVLGCFYFGWIAFATYQGSRFEDFGGAGIGEANAGALTIVTGVLVAAGLFLAGRAGTKWTIVGIMPIVVNALVTTISRSGFLAFGVGGLIFNLFTPKRYRWRVSVLSALGLVLFALLANPIYWARIGTLKHAGQEVEGLDTGAGRIDIIRAQWQMFSSHPAGCGHMCTTVLSPSYLGSGHLVEGGRASHNTFMSMLVDHSLPGAAVYLLMVLWTFTSVSTLLGRFRGADGLIPCVIPAIAGSLGAIFIADMFVQYIRLEVRFWFIALVIVLLQWNPEYDRRETQ